MIHKMICTVCAMLIFFSLFQIPASAADNQASTSDPLSEDGVQIIAHRGFSGIAPENTLAAFRLAGQYGFWGAECDIQQTSDGVWVIMHDSFIDRTTDGSGTVSNMSYSELLEFTVDSGNGIEQYPNEKIPTLIEYLDVCRDYGMHPVIEIKYNADVSQMEALASILNVRKEKASFVIASFNGILLSEIKRLLPCVKVYMIRQIVSDYDIAYSLRKKIDGISFSTSVSKEMINKVHSAGLKSMVWTIDDEDMMEYYRSHRVEFILSNSIAPQSEPSEMTAGQYEESQIQATAPDETEHNTKQTGEQNSVSIVSRILSFIRDIFRMDFSS